MLPPSIRTADFISDLHLSPELPRTLAALSGYLRRTKAEAIFILGDLFEAWVGDDSGALPFEASVVEMLTDAARRCPLYVMRGNRDFLLGTGFFAATGAIDLPDPVVVHAPGISNEPVLLSHGDALCLEDTDYLKFRAQVRTPEWQSAFLARPLEERRALARSMRVQSEDRKRNPSTVWADVDTDAARQWLRQSGAHTLVHGHTHRPAHHDLGDGLHRLVLSDWDAAAHPPRAQLLCLSTAGAQRVDLR